MSNLSTKVTANVPMTADETRSLMAFARAIADAQGLIPKDYVGHPNRILAAFATGRELGIGPMASLRALYIVEGRPTASYDFWIARLKQAGYGVEWVEHNSERAVVKLTDPAGHTHEDFYTIQMADRARLLGKSNWKNYPETMLMARAVTKAGRAFAAEVMFGCYESDEIEEIRRGDATVIDDPVESVDGDTRLGVNGLANRLGVTDDEPDPEPAPETDDEPRFEFVEEALAAIGNANDGDRLRALQDICRASGFTNGEAQQIREAFADRVAELEEAAARMED